jgi:hypothetical protein
MRQQQPLCRCRRRSPGFAAALVAGAAAPTALAAGLLNPAISLLKGLRSCVFPAHLPTRIPPSHTTSLFRTVPSDRYQGQYAAAKMLELGLKTAVVAFTDSSYGQSLAFAFIAAFTRDGGRAYPVAVPVGSRNTTGIMAEIARVQPAGIFIASNSVEFMAGALRRPGVPNARGSDWRRELGWAGGPIGSSPPEHGGTARPGALVL